MSGSRSPRLLALVLCFACGAGSEKSPQQGRFAGVTGASADFNLAVALTVGGTVWVAGQTAVSYKITVTNNGPDAGTGRVTSTPPAYLPGSLHWTCVSIGAGATCGAASGATPIDVAIGLPAGRSVELVVNFTASPSLPTGISIMQATVTGDQTDPVDANNTATTAATAVLHVVDADVTFSDGKATATSGDADSYQLHVVNNGPSDLSGTLAVALDAAFTGASYTCTGTNGATGPVSGSGAPAGAISIPVLGTPRPALDCTITGAIASSFTGPLTSSATVNAGEEESAPANNSATDTTAISAPAVTPPDCESARLEPERLWPPDHRLVPIGVTVAGASVQVTSIEQTEPVHEKGSGNTGPDGALSASGEASVRAERSGTHKSGRLYLIGFTATNDGGSCSATAAVCVPHSFESECQDTGARFDSLTP